MKLKRDYFRIIPTFRQLCCNLLSFRKLQKVCIFLSIFIQVFESSERQDALPLLISSVLFSVILVEKLENPNFPLVRLKRHKKLAHSSYPSGLLGDSPTYQVSEVYFFFFLAWAQPLFRWGGGWWRCIFFQRFIQFNYFNLHYSLLIFDIWELH